MKYVITESRLENFVFKLLDKEFKNLNNFKLEGHPHIFYIQEGNVIFFYDTETEVLYVPNDPVGNLLSKILDLNKDEIETILKIWVNHNYKLNINSIGMGNFKNLEKIKNGIRNKRE
jgi:hypothetical protein